MSNANVSDVSSLKKMFADYKKEDNDNKPKILTKEEKLARYFVPRKEKEVFRILPPLQGRDHIETAFFHAVRTNAAGGQKRWRKIYCPAHNDAKVQKMDANGQPVFDADGKPFMVAPRCPLCEKSKAMLAKQDQSIRKIKPDDMTEAQKAIKASNDKIYKDAMSWDAKKFYIVRGVDKGATGDGVKFWRFKHNYRKQGVKDKLIPALENFIDQYEVDFTHPQLGTDVIISTFENKTPTGKPFTDVANIMTRGQVTLADDPIVVKQWVDDPTIWRDVFKPAQAPQLTSEEYLERIARGVDPYWDDTDANNKRWVFPDPADAELMVKANTRDQNLGSNTQREQNVEQASDLVSASYDNVTIENVTKEDVGTFQDDAVDVGAEVAETAPVVQTQETPTTPVVESSPQVEEQTVQEVQESVVENNEPSGEDYDDLPF